MSNVTPRQHLLRYLAEQSTNYVAVESTKRIIERLAEEFMRDLRADPTWRDEIRQEANRAARLIAASLRAVREDEEAHSGRKRSPRKTKRRRPGTRTSRTS